MNSTSGYVPKRGRPSKKMLEAMALKNQQVDPGNQRLDRIVSKNQQAIIDRIVSKNQQAQVNPQNQKQRIDRVDRELWKNQPAAENQIQIQGKDHHDQGERIPGIQNLFAIAGRWNGRRQNY